MRIKQGLTLRKVGKDYMVVELSESKANLTSVYTLNESAAWLWNEFYGKDFTPEEMIERLCDEYDVDREKAREDVGKLLADIEKSGLLL